ncbi:MAG: S-layer homology domain-containing protein [Cyanobacteriota bacterium]
MYATSVLSDKRPVLLTGFALCLLSVLTSCASGPTSEALERSLGADPKLKNSSTIFGGSSSGDRQNQSLAQLPNDYPKEIPLYPDAQLQGVEALTVTDAQGQLTTWSSGDPINMIQTYYQKEFASKNWQIVSQPTDSSGGTIVARQNDLQVTVTIPASATPSNTQTTSSTTPPATSKATSSATEFEIQYVRNPVNAAATPSTPPEVAQPVESPEVATQPNQATSTQSQDFTDLEKLPQELRQQVQDLAALGVLSVDQSGTKQNTSTNSNSFQPTKVIARREFARWLVAANNQMYANRPGQQIRLASDTSQPAFQDVPRTHPDFPSIQALAEAGLIPSPLTGDSTAVLFRPDAPLTRENLILWKVPLDTRQALPTASLDAVKQTWGFQDAAKIEPKALRAALADFQNSEQSNIRRVFGYTTLFQPKKPVTRAEAAAALGYFGSQGEGLSAKEALQLKRQPSQPAATPEPTPSTSPS